MRVYDFTDKTIYRKGGSNMYDYSDTQIREDGDGFKKLKAIDPAQINTSPSEIVQKANTLGQNERQNDTNISSGN